ncbi:MAG: Hsp33 family molecular chaperone HslO [Pseudobdellovibrionaceae bacterium]
MTQSSERVHRFVTNDFTIRAACVNATEAVATMQQIQGTLPIATVAVGRAMVGAILMSSNMKEGSIGLLFKGNGALLSVYAEAAQNGDVRGYTPMGHYSPPDYKEGLSIKDHIGNGFLTVSRILPHQKTPHQGTVKMVSGEIGEDIAHYLHQSQQIRSVISVGVYVDTYGKVLSAGGVLIEVMPGVEQDVVTKLEENVKSNTTLVSKMILEGKSALELVEPFLKGFDYTELDHDFPVRYSCPCTKERVLDAMMLFGIPELDDIIQKNEQTAVTCQMCGKPYELSVEDIKTVRDKMHKSSLH